VTFSFRTWLLITAVIAPNFAMGQTSGINPTLILDHLYPSTSFSQWQAFKPMPGPSSEPLSQQAAAVLANDLIERLSIDEDVNATEQGQLLSNAGVLQTYSGDLIGGRLTLDESLEMLMTDRHQFDPAIATLVTAIGINAFLQEDFEVAENHFRWSQHIQHREDGIYSANQAKNLNWLTRVYLAEQDFTAADTAQRYILRIARNTYEEGSPELTKVKDGIAKYLAQRGKMISPLSDELQRALRQTLFAEAITLLDENLRSIEANFGPQTLALVDTLETQADIYYWRGNHNRQQERALERALDILRLQPTPSPDRLAAAWFNLADGYVLTGNRKAISAYASGWSLKTSAAVTTSHEAPGLSSGTTAPTAISTATADPSKSPSPSLDIAGAIDTGPLPTQPALLWPEAYAALYFAPVNEAKYPADVDYYVDFSFTISNMGKPKRIRITDRNVPSEEARWARSAIHSSRYRPALVDGVAVPFETTYRQAFTRIAPLSESPPAADPSAAQPSAQELLPSQP